MIGVGEWAPYYAPDVLFPDSDACAATVSGLLAHSDHVLVKGSASVGMDGIVAPDPTDRRRRRHPALANRNAQTNDEPLSVT